MDVGNTEQFKGSAGLLKENYGRVLDRYLPAELRQPGRNLRAISIGCGFGLELKGLQQLLPNAHIEAIDQSADNVRGAIQWNLEFPQDRIRLADATQRESLGDEEWDLIIIRNPQVQIIKGEINEGWQRIFKNCFDKLKQNGFLYVTTLSGIEMQGVLVFLSQLPLQDVTSNDPEGTHVIEPPIESHFPYTEHYIAVLKKIAPSQ